MTCSYTTTNMQNLAGTLDTGIQRTECAWSDSTVRCGYWCNATLAFSSAECPAPYVAIPEMCNPTSFGIWAPTIKTGIQCMAHAEALEVCNQYTANQQLTRPDDPNPLLGTEAVCAKNAFDFNFTQGLRTTVAGGCRLPTAGDPPP
jgi:hypothetical protein